jgi:predicted dinucleotide-binding enzyme
MVAVMEREMVRRNDTAAKVDAEVVADAKVVAAFRGIPLAQYLTEVLRAVVKRDLETEMTKRQRSPTAQVRKPKAGD